MSLSPAIAPGADGQRFFIVPNPPGPLPPARPITVSARWTSVLKK